MKAKHRDRRVMLSKWGVRGVIDSPPGGKGKAIACGKLEDRVAQGLWEKETACQVGLSGFNNLD
jgi:hypothetical protein